MRCCQRRRCDPCLPSSREPCYPKCGIAGLRVMTRTDCGLPRCGTSKPPLLRVDRLSKLLIAGLVILIVTSEFKRDGARAQTSSPQRVTISDGARATASSLFGDRCAVCHGPNGDGD